LNYIMSIYRHLLALSVAALFMCSCSQGGDSSGSDIEPTRDTSKVRTEKSNETHRYSSVTESNLLTAINAGEARYPGQLQIQVNLTIGDQRNQEEYLLVQPSSVFTDDEGRLYIYDDDRPGVMVYDDTGKFLRQIGRSGSGPGDLMSPLHQHVFKDGTLDVIDPTFRWQRWLSNGELQFDRREQGIHYARNSSLLTSFNGFTSFTYQNPWAIPVTRDTSTAILVIEYDVTAAQIIGVAEELPIGRPSFIEAMIDGNRMGMTTPYSPGIMLFQDGDGGYIYTTGDEPHYIQYDSFFQKTQEVRWEQSLHELEIKEVLNTQRDDRFAQYRSDDWNERLLKLIRMSQWPQFKPAVSHIVAGLDGRIWVEDWGNEPWARLLNFRNNTHHFEYRVFSPSGELEFHTELPFRVQAADTNHLFEIYSDGESDPLVRRYQWMPPK